MAIGASVHRPGSLLEEKRLLAFRPIDNHEMNSAPEHFGFKIGGVLLPFGCVSDTEYGFAAIPFEVIIGRQGPPYPLIHHGEASVRERLVVHRTHLMKKKPPPVSLSDGFSNSHGDHQKVTVILHLHS